MPTAASALKNNTLSSLMARAPEGIVNAIRTARAKTGVDFAYLMEKAGAESNFNPAIKAKTSSATGLFQFIDSTWMQMVKNHGHKYGLGDLAAEIDNRGRVADKGLKKDILDLRKDPEIASFMAAEFASENEAHLKRTVGGDIGPTELYFAHFMGAGGASAFLKEMKHNPLAVGADIFPREASANRGVFYDPQTGQARTLGQIYERFDKKFSGSPAESAPSVPATETILAMKAKPVSDVFIPSQSLSRSPLFIDSHPAPARSLFTNMDRDVEPDTEAGWQIFPPSMYSRLSIAPSEMAFLAKLND